MINPNAILLFFLVLTVLLALLHQEDIKRFLRNTLFPNARKKGKYVKICPKCGSVKIQVDFSNPVVWAYGTSVKYKCRKCGYLGTLFPEILKEELPKYLKDFDKKLRQGKIKFKKEELIDVSTGFFVGIWEIIISALLSSLLLFSLIISFFDYQYFDVDEFWFLILVILWTAFFIYLVLKFTKKIKHKNSF